MEPLDVAQRYFDAWNRHDPAAVLDILEKRHVSESRDGRSYRR